jgi:hypothetical protein
MRLALRRSRRAVLSLQLLAARCRRAALSAHCAACVHHQSRRATASCEAAQACRRCAEVTVLGFLLQAACCNVQDAPARCWLSGAKPISGFELSLAAGWQVERGLAVSQRDVLHNSSRSLALLTLSCGVSSSCSLNTLSSSGTSMAASSHLQITRSLKSGLR